MRNQPLSDAKKLRENGANASDILRYLHRYYPYLQRKEVWWIIEQVIKAA